jgi:hypothetical protein
MSYDQLKEKYKAKILYRVNTYQFIYIATCIQRGLDTPLKPVTFKSTILIYKFILNTNKWCLVFVMFSFDLNIIFSSKLSIFELWQRK